MALKVSLCDKFFHLGCLLPLALSYCRCHTRGRLVCPYCIFYCQIYHTTRWFAHATLLRCKITMEDNIRIHNLGLPFPPPPVISSEINVFT